MITVVASKFLFYEVTNKDLVLHKLYQELLPLSKPDMFPGPLPCSIERKDIAELQKRSLTALVTPKADGVRMLLYMTAIDNKHMCFAITRSLEVFLVPGIQLVDSLYRGTVLDGELVEWGGTAKTFLAFDAFRMDGKNICCLPLSKRLQLCRHGLFTGDTLPAAKNFQVKMKPYFPIWAMATLREFVTSNDTYKTDGVVLCHDEPLTRFGRNYSFLKWKPLSRVSVDFRLGPKGKLYVYNQNKFEGVATAASTEDLKEGCIVECECEGALDDIVWRVLKVRTDKMWPNDMLTYRKTIENISENVTFEELVQRFTRT